MTRDLLMEAMTIISDCQSHLNPKRPNNEADFTEVSSIRMRSWALMKKVESHIDAEKSCVRIWHDDVRPAPEGWKRARTNTEALALLREHGKNVLQISMDHDLGSTEEGNVYAKGAASETGLDLARTMLAEGLVPPVVVIHSWNPAGAQAMHGVLAEADADVWVEPYRVDWK